MFIKEQSSLNPGLFALATQYVPTPKGQSMSSLGISSMYITCCFPAVPTAQNTYIRSYTASVATGTVLGGPQLVHLGHALLEFFVLALLVGMSLVLKAVSVSWCLLKGAPSDWSTRN